MKKRKRKKRGSAALILVLFILGGAAAFLLWQNRPVIHVESLELSSDADGDGLHDLADLVEGARVSVEARPVYLSTYYEGGYPPESEGVCSDVIWRAFQHAGYDLKAMVDEDIAENTSEYPRVAGAPDPNIDFRRVANLNVFFSRKAAVLTLDLQPGNAENLYQWQGGDIVIVKSGDQYHIGILSDKRNRDGVPYVIHHPDGMPREEDCLAGWADILVGNYRFPAEK